MTALEVYNFLKNSGKFSDLIFGEPNSNVRYSPFAEIKYIINKSEYTIFVTNEYQYSFFRCHPFTDIKGLEFVILNDFCEEKTIISNFKRLLKKIIKLDIYIQNREIDKIVIKDIINNHIKKTYNLNVDLTYGYLSKLFKNYMTIKFSPKNITSRIKRKPLYQQVSYNKKLFDTSLEHYSKYDIWVFFNNNNSHVALNLYYDGESKKLLSIAKNESYQPFSNDITKIIRKEKLIKLMNDD